MKQADIIVGETYLFKKTIHDHKKDMVGSHVKVVGKKNGNKKVVISHYISQDARAPMKFKLENGRWAAACELEKIGE